MSLSHESMMAPAIEQLLDRMPSKFGLVTLAARRGRDINSYFGQLGEGSSRSVPPQVSSVSRKPLSIAFEEVAAGKIVWAEPIEESPGVLDTDYIGGAETDTSDAVDSDEPVDESGADDAG